MKTKLFIILSICIIALTGCGPSYKDSVAEQTVSNNTYETEDYFTELLEWEENGCFYKIVYANDTNVKYLIGYTGYRYGITPLYNADGSLQLYEPEGE